jgi:hypothetical protein
MSISAPTFDRSAAKLDTAVLSPNSAHDPGLNALSPWSQGLQARARDG